MKIVSKKKGQMRVIEAILASFVIIFALAFVNFFNTNPSSERYETTELDKLGYNALHDLDTQGLLANYVYNQEWENLRNAISVTLPVDVYFNVRVLFLNQSVINQDAMYYGKPEVFDTATAISSVSYPLVGYIINSNIDFFDIEAIYDPCIVVLQLVRG